MKFFMRRATHERLLAAQVIADTAERQRQQDQHDAELAAFKRDLVEQAAHESAALRNEVLALTARIAALNGKLVHVIDNPSAARTVDKAGR